MMTYATIFTAFACVFAGFIVHVVWWRVRRPKDDVRALFLCLVGLPLSLAVARGLVLFGDVLAEDGVAVFVLAAILGGAYILTYPGAQAGSPSMLILLKLAEKSDGGMTRDELLASFSDADLCDETLASLVNEHFAAHVDGRLTAAPRGQFLVRTCEVWRRVLGLGDGQG
jgi:hypothetical protein